MQCEICGITDKDTRIINSKKYGCLCRKHYLRKYKGKDMNKSIYEPNEYVLYDTYAEIILKDKNCDECGRAIIDLDDVEKCKSRKWHLKRNKTMDYAMSSDSVDRIFLHRLIMNYYGYDQDIDHINRNGLDNRKKNLRLVSHGKNITNQEIGTGIKQVPSGNYQVTIGKDYKRIYLGTFSNYADALATRQWAEEMYEGLYT